MAQFNRTLGRAGAGPPHSALTVSIPAHAVCPRGAGSATEHPRAAQCTCGCLEMMLWWILNPWWDLVMLGFFAYANALWQSCDMCSLKNCPSSGQTCKCQNGKPTCGT